MSKRYTLTLSDELAENVEALAVKKHMKTQEFIRRCLVTYLVAYEKSKKS